MPLCEYLEFLSLTLASKLVGCREVLNNPKNPSVSVSTLTAFLASLKRDRYHFPLELRAASFPPSLLILPTLFHYWFCFGSFSARASDISSESFPSVSWPQPDPAAVIQIALYVFWMFAAPSNPSTSSYILCSGSCFPEKIVPVGWPLSCWVISSLPHLRTLVLRCAHSKDWAIIGYYIH